MKLKEFIKAVNDAGIEIIDDVLKCGNRTYGFLDSRRYVKFFSDGMTSERVKIKSILDMNLNDVLLRVEYDVCNIFPPSVYSSFEVKGRVLQKPFI